MKGRGIKFLLGLLLLLNLAACGEAESGAKKTKGSSDHAGQEQTTNEPSSENDEQEQSTNEPSSENSEQQLKINAVASNWQWELDKTTVRAGDSVTFVVTSNEGTHSFSISGTNINQEIAEGESKEVVWTPDQPGEYTIVCDYFCGTGHSGMKNKIVVE